ncbi:MAG: spheroidene monooxygenase [Pseudomonadota bacterium]
MPQTVSLSFYRFGTPQSRIWAFVMMGIARLSMPRVPGIGFWKLCGSGTGEGFTPVPNISVYAILATWPDEKTARTQTAGAAIYQRYQAKAAEHWTVFLTPTQARGAWAGTTPFQVGHASNDGPLAALTRATIKPTILQRFWGHVPAISDVIGSDPNVAFKIGIGEVPWLHQVTFSIWPNARAMAQFARGNGPHGQAIRAVREGAWFKEELYARFAILGEAGSWNGHSPLAQLTPDTKDTK